ncbi:hypothetical protein ACSSZE_03185 [Acidithiobacillus caldus]
MNAVLRLPIFAFSRALFKRLLEALLATIFLYGGFFVLICIFGGLGAFARTLVFWPGFVQFLEIAFPFIWVMLFVFALLAEFFQAARLELCDTSTCIRLWNTVQSGRWTTWAKAHQGISTFLAMGLFTAMVAVMYYYPASGPVVVPPPPPFPVMRPVSKVLIHLEGENKKKQGTVIWRRNIVGPARIQNLGHGRYLVQLEK